MSKKLVWENLPLDKTVRDLLPLLDPVGTVQWLYMPVDANSQKFTGRAYLEMWSDTEADLVIGSFHNKPLDGNITPVSLVKGKESPDQESNKTAPLTVEHDYIYSVIRLQVSAPVGAVIFINDIPKIQIEDSGEGVIRSLLPGTYDLKVGFQDVLLAQQDITVNCDEEPPRLRLAADETVTQAMAAITRSSAAISSYGTLEMSSLSPGSKVTKATGATPAAKSITTNTKAAPIFSNAPITTIFMEAAKVEEIGSQAKKKRKALWLAFSSVVIVLIVVGVIAIPKLTAKKEDTPTKDKPTIPTVIPQGMVYVPPGNVVIGRNNTKDEFQKPVHSQVLADGYFMDKTEVTNEEYWQFTQDTKRATPTYWKGEAPGLSILKFPVVNVSWDDAVAYCQWRGSRKKLLCRLPSEVEWEHAARGDKNYIYPWGMDWEDGAANANNKKGKVEAVGSYSKDTSPYGLLDMAGNVREWTRDDYLPYPGSAAPHKNDVKVARGGAYSDDKDEATTTFRNYLPPNTKDADRTGFRCLCELEQTAK